MKKIVLTGGGTLGHVAPALALMPKLIENGYSVDYIGSKSALEQNLIKHFPLRFHAIQAGKLRRYSSLQNLSDPFKVLAGMVQSLFLLRKIKPDILFSKGGYVSVPVVLAAAALGIPIISHESDLTPGLATRIGSRFAKKVCCNFKECADSLGAKGVHTGLPLRAELFSGEREAGLQIAGFSGEKPVLLCIGGSQGSQAVNAALRETLPVITKKYDVFHICGKGNLDSALDKQEGYFQIEFLGDSLKDALAASDIVLSRAGATAITELHSLQKPMLLIPLGRNAGRGDQIQNAENYEKKGFALVLSQEDVHAQSLIEAIDKLYAQRKHIAQNLSDNPPPKAVDTIVSLLETYRKQKKNSK